MTLNLALVISGQASGAKEAIQGTRAEVKQLGTDAAATSRTLAAANDQAVASTQRVIQALTQQSEIQKRINSAVGVQPAANDEQYSQRAAQVASYGSELDRLRAKYNPLFAVEQQRAETLREIDQALKVGAISEAEHAAAVNAAGFAYQRQVRGLSEVGGAARLTSFQLLNLSRQGNDVVTMFALGISPMQIFASQAGQIYDALESGPKGLRGSLAAIAVAGRNALSALLAFAVTPPGMIVGAAAAAVAGIVTYFVSTRQQVKSLDALLQEHADILKGIGEIYDGIAGKAKNAFSPTATSLRLQSSATRAELQIQMANQMPDLVGAMGFQSGIGRGTGSRFDIRRQFAPFSDAITYLRETAAKGTPDILGFRKMVEDRWSLDPNNSALTIAAGKLLELTKDAQAGAIALGQLKIAQDQLANSLGPGGIPLRRGELSTEDTGSYSQYLAAQKVEIARQQQAFDAQRMAIYARSPSQIAAAARAAAASQYNNDEDPDARTRRIDQAGQLAYLQSQHQIVEAQNDRVRSTVTLLDQMRRENDLIGKNAGEVAAAQFAHQRLMEIRDEAIRNGITNEQEFQRVFGKEIALIGEAAAKVKEYAEASARAHLKDDLGFDAAQLGRSPIEQRVASTMRQYGLGNDLNGPDAAIIRTNERLKQQVDIWKDIRKSGMDAYSDIFDLAFDGFDNWKDRLSDIAKDMAKNLFDMSVKNPFLNRQYGADLPTLDQAGGLGGWINTLLGGSPNPAAGLGQLGTMANPMYVVPVGGLGGDGGIVGDVTRLLSGANDNGAGTAAKTVASLVPGGGALASAAGQALSFVGNYKQGVDNRLTDILSEASQRFGGFGVSAFSGRRPGDPRFHGQGLATDVRLTDLASGKALANYQDPSTFRTYEQFAQVARQVQMEKYPELADQFRWGGYFSGGRGKYGAMDQMHFDLGGGKVGMAGGSWANGLTPAQRALFPGVESLGMGANKAVAALGRLDVTTTAATQNLGQFGSGLGQFGQNLAKSVSQASGGGSSGGGFFGMLASPFGGGQTRFAGDILSGARVGLFDVGGATGGSDPRRVAGLVHEKEYVLDEPVVRALGVPFLDRMRAAAKSGRGFAVGGYGGGSAPAGSPGAAWTSSPKIERHYHDMAGIDIREEQSDDGTGGMREDIYIERRVAAATTRRGSAANKALVAMGVNRPQKVR